MSKHLHALCCSIIDDYYGEFYARIFYHLTHNGRFNSYQLAQKTHLPVKQVKFGLATLVQLRLIYHHTSSEGLSTYQANSRSAYNILRSGKLINLVRINHGDLAADILTEASLLGFTTVAELQNRVITSQSKHNNAPTNMQKDSSVGPDIDEYEVQTIIQTLIKETFLSYVRSAHFQTTFDASKDVEMNLKSMGQAGAKSRKALMELEERIASEVNIKQNTGTAEPGHIPHSTAGLKRPADEMAISTEKRQKLSNGLATHRPNGTTPSIQMTTLLSVNYNNAVAHTRNEYLASIANISLGQRFGHVLKSILAQVPISDPFNMTQDKYWLDTSLIRDSLNDQRSNLVVNGNHKQNGADSHSHEDDPFDRGYGLSYGELDRHLALLSESTSSFLKGGYSKGQWHIDNKDLTSFIQQQESLRIMGNGLGSPALRLIRMLIEKGKLDEKALQETGLLGAKDLRQTLADLNQMGFIDLQEIPREAQRQPNRTIFLWFHDSERVRKVLLEGLYKAMTRLIQRLSMERKDLASTLEKVERSDVKGSEEQMLPAAELTIWKRWQRKEEWLLGEISRLDDSVAILRDL